MSQAVTHHQVGALPFRIDRSGQTEILIVTSRRTRRWIVPKGWPMEGLKDADAAAREAYEEAGLEGVVSGSSIGTFTYEKVIASTEVTRFAVDIYPLRVERQLTCWKEMHQRQTAWVPVDLALQMIDNQGLREIVAAFTPNQKAA